MTRFAPVSLRFALPFGLLCLLLVLFITSLGNAIVHRKQILTQQAAQEMRAQGAHLARAASHGLACDSPLLEGDVTYIGSDPRVRAVAVLDADARVLYAHRPDWKGQAAAQVITDFNATRFARAAAGSLPDQTTNPEDVTPSLLMPYASPAPDEALRGPRNGVIYLQYDLAAQHEAIHRQAIRARLPELLGMSLLALALGWLLHRQVSLPLRQLTQASRRIADGDFSARAARTGLAEVADLGHSFNRMAHALDAALVNLRASEEQLAVTLHSIGDALIATDLAGQVTLMNPVAERLTGWTLAQARGTPVQEIFRIEDARTGRPAEIPVTRVLDSGTVVGLANHTVLVARDGARHHIADSAAPIRDEQGQLMGVVMVFRDVSEEYQLREALRESEQHFRTLANSGQALIWTAGTDKQCDAFNQVWLDFTGRTLQQELGEGWLEGVHPEDFAACLQSYVAAFDRREKFSIVYRLRRHDGAYRWLLDEGTPRFDSQGRFIGFIGHCLDITERRLLEADAVRRRAELEAIFQALPDQFFRVDSDNVIIDCKMRDAGPWYAPPEAFLGRQVRALMPLDASQRIEQALAQTRASGTPSACEYPLPMADGVRWFEAHMNRLGDDAEVIVLVREISARKQAEADIHQLAYYDALTNLPNRRLFMDRLSQTLAATRRGQHVGALLFIDLDQFKRINDARGHELGDAVLRQVGARLTRFLRDEDTVARLGGDEFVVLLANLAHAPEDAARLAMGVAEKIRGLLHQPFKVEEVDYHIGASIGITVFPKGDENGEDLLREADTAMYRAKDAGRNTVIYFESAMQESVRARLALEQDLHHAIDAGQMRVYLQPQVDADGLLVCAEALVRWHHPERGLISPAAFIPVAEESGLILELGTWVLTEAARLLRECDDDGRPLRLAVNLSPRQFRQADFVEHVRGILQAAGANPSHLVLEVTEGLVIEDIHDTIAKMEALSELGIHFSIDDFGTGYSSLAYLKRLPLNELKIDRTFVQDAPNHPNDAALVETILSVARHLNLKVVAEGVETEAQFAFLKARDCGAFQGYLFDRPLPCAAFKAKWRR